jgi:hypothetical protein
MQYNNGERLPIARGKSTRTDSNVMQSMLSRFALRILAALVPLALGACADTLTNGKPIASNAELQREYDKTMTKTEQAAAISDLAQEKARQEQAVQEDDSGTGGTPEPAAGGPAATSKSVVSSKPVAPAAPVNQAY